MSAHTPGPWTYSPALLFASGALVRRGDSIIAEAWPIDPSGDMQTANARLIAAAPDLLAAIAVVSRCVADDQGGVTLGSHEMSIVRAALAKAAGGA